MTLIPLFEDFKLYFPSAAKMAVKCFKGSVGELVVLLNDDTYISYDEFRNSIRNLPKDPNNMTEAQFRREFGRRLTNMMMIKGVCGIELSERTGIPRSMLSNYLTGKNTPSFYKVDKIARALNCSTDEFRLLLDTDHFLYK